MISLLDSSIGLIGKGFVGEAFYEGMKNHFDIFVWDTDPSKRNVGKLDDLLRYCKVSFISVPTPMKKDGSCDTSILESVIRELDSYYDSIPLSPHILVIRSTIPPGTTDKLQLLTQNISLVFNPEFLTEANHIQDFKNQQRIILGGFSAATNIVKDIYKNTFPQATIVTTESRVAEMSKYLSNLFLATKVTFANEMKEICDAIGINYQDVVRTVVPQNERLGQSHWQVPGPDGKRGFGGTCFPKDLNALLAYARDLGIKTPFLSSVWEKNLQVRPERDWEQMKGRAVSE